MVSEGLLKEQEGSLETNTPLMQQRLISVAWTWFKNYITPDMGKIYNCYIAKFDTTTNFICLFTNKGIECFCYISCNGHYFILASLIPHIWSTRLCFCMILLFSSDKICQRRNNFLTTAAVETAHSQLSYRDRNDIQKLSIIMAPDHSSHRFRHRSLTLH